MNESLHTGHRHRLRERYRTEGLEHFADHEVLELLLFSSHARGDTNPIAHALLDNYGTLKGVLEASPEDLLRVKGIGEESAVLISLMVPMFRRYAASQREAKRRILGSEDAAAYCASLLTGLRNERFYVLCLDKKGYLLGARLASEGTLDQVPAYPRLVAEIALRHNAASVILCHNHPSGDSTPSRDDLTLTHRLDRLLEDMEISLLDHIIVGAGDCYSLAAHGELHRKPSLIPNRLGEDGEEWEKT